MPDANKNEEQEKTESATAAKPAVSEAGDKYTGDGTVVGINDNVGGEEPLVDAPEDFVQYGGKTEITGDGLRKPGSFRMQFRAPFAHFRNLVAIPFVRFG